MCIRDSLYAENVSLGSGSDGMSNGMYASSDPLAGGGLADHGVFLAAASPLRLSLIHIYPRKGLRRTVPRCRRCRRSAHRGNFPGRGRDTTCS